MSTLAPASSSAFQVSGWNTRRSAVRKSKSMVRRGCPRMATALPPTRAYGDPSAFRIPETASRIITTVHRNRRAPTGLTLPPELLHGRGTTDVMSGHVLSDPFVGEALGHDHTLFRRHASEPLTLLLAQIFSQLAAHRVEYNVRRGTLFEHETHRPRARPPPLRRLPPRRAAAAHPARAAVRESGADLAAALAGRQEHRLAGRGLQGRAERLSAAGARRYGAPPYELARPA